MKTVLKKPFSVGFSLTEQELRRIHNTMVQQMKIKSKNTISSFFELRYKNGVRAEKATLDEIIADNNSGEWEIQELKMNLVSKNRLLETKIEIEFRVPPPPPSKESTQRPYSIQYDIVGDERDWVYLTSSQLDDRIANLKQHPLFEFLIFALALSVVLLFVSIATFAPTSKILLPLGCKIGGLFVSAALVICFLTVLYGFRSYNFCWGDYLKIYNDRRTVAKYVINGIIVALALGIMGSIITNLIFLR